MQITQLRLALNNLRRSVQEVLRNRGVEVRKVPTSFEPIPVFRLAVEALMSRRGDALSFVQVGANDGVFVDPLRQYILTRGWSGILVEPQADVFERLKENYADCADRLIFENVAVSLSSQLELFLPPADLGTHDPRHAHSVVSNNAVVLAKTMNVTEARLRRVTVPAVTLDELLSRHNFTHLDLLQIDAEGYDWEVLRTLNMKKIKPTLIQFESGPLNRHDLNAVVNHLSESGYLVYYGGYQGDALAMQRDFFEFI